MENVIKFYHKLANMWTFMDMQHIFNHLYVSTYMQHIILFLISNNVFDISSLNWL